MLDSLSPRRRRLVLALVAGVAVLVVAVLAVVVVRQVDSRPTAVQDELGPVLLVPGYGGNMLSLQPLAEQLRAQGREVVTVQPPGNGTGDLRVEAELLGDVAREALTRTGASSVDVIGYSAGGVAARLWVSDGDGAQLARRVLTLGSPHHGADGAALALEAAGGCPQACQQLVPSSDLLRELNAGDETPDGPRWITVRSSSDQTVTPTDSATLDGAIDVLVQDICPAATTPHGGLPSDPVVLALLSAVLGTAEPSVPDDISC